MRIEENTQHTLIRGKNRGRGECEIWSSYECDSQQEHHLPATPATKLPATKLPATELHSYQLPSYQVTSYPATKLPASSYPATSQQRQEWTKRQETRRRRRITGKIH